MKYQIGVVSVGNDLVVGSLTAAMVVVPPDFFRKHSTIFRASNEAVFNIMGKDAIFWYVFPLKPEDIKSIDYKQQEVNAMIECLNSFKEFWKHDVNIQFTPSNAFQEYFKDGISRGLKMQELKSDKWSVAENNKAKVCKLANLVAEYYKEKEAKRIKRIYGEFGTGKLNDPITKKFIESNPDCPHVRKYYAKKEGAR